MLADIEIHEDPRMPAKSLLQERTRDFFGIVRQQLRLHAMDSGRLLQGFDDVGKQTFFDFAAIRTAGSVADEQVSNDALTLFVNKKGVTEDAAALNRGIARQDFRIHVTQD